MKKEKYYVHTHSGTYTHISGPALEPIIIEAGKRYTRFSISTIVKKPSPFNPSKITDHFQVVYRRN